MIGSLVEIGSFTNAEQFCDAAMDSLAGALGWDYEDGVVKYPNHDLAIRVWYQTTTGRVELCNSYSTSDNFGVTNMTRSDYKHYWNIAQMSEGVVIIRMLSYNINTDIWTIPPFQMAITFNSDNALVGVMSNTAKVQMLFENQFILNYSEATIYNAIYKLALIKQPDPLHGGTLKGLYHALHTPSSSYADVYEMNDKRYINVANGSFNVIAAID